MSDIKEMTNEEMKEFYRKKTIELENIKKIINNEIQFVTDGYHNFDELYFHRMILFSVICSQNKDKAWKSKFHHDGTMYDNYFIVGITTDRGQYSYHYHMQYYDYFKDITEFEKSPKYDGHKSSDITRLLSLLR